MNRTERLHAITEALRRAGRRGVTAERLAQEYEVSTRTIKRDVAALARSGLPVWGQPGPTGGFGLAETSSLPPINLTAAQAVGLAAAVAAAGQAPFADAGRAAVAKIKDVLDPAMRARADELAGRVWVDHAAAPPRRIRSAVEQALANRVTVKLTYHNAAGVVSRREVEPQILALAGGEWYLVGWCRLRQGIRWFRLSRIAAATVTTHSCPERPLSEIGPPPESARPVG